MKIKKSYTFLLSLLLLLVQQVPAQEIDYDFIVAQDGSGDFKTVQEAFNAVPDFRKVPTRIYIKKGVYKEKLILAGSKQFVHVYGEDAEHTILTYDDYAQKKNIFGEEKGTSGSASFYVYADDFMAQQITFENSAGPVGQAVAIWVAGDRAAFYSCRFLGFQDTLYTYGKGAKQFYSNCYIEGTVDFIFGSATAWFESCTLFCKTSGYITAASTPQESAYGYVFNNCKVIADAKPNSFYLGRPWRPFARVVFMNCELPEAIKPAGWHNWAKESNEQTAYYAEYNNSGNGAAISGRVAWSHQLNEQQITAYSIAEVLGDWVPAVP